jgi:hypothetical protein
MRRIAVLVLLLGAALAAVLVRGPSPESSTASSHREAPLISNDPVADNVDVYAFVSPNRPDTVTMVATYIPLEEPAGGPNFYGFGEDVLYGIHVDNDRDGEEDVSYEFRFDTRTRNKDTFLYNTGPIDSLTDPDWNVRQFYSVKRVIEERKKRTLAGNVRSTPNNIGPRSTPSYESLMAAGTRNLPGGIKVFAGQVDDPFFVDLGSIFDLGGLRPFNPAHVIPLPAENGVDGLSGFNTHAIVIQVPIDKLTEDRRLPTGPNDRQAVLGIYASAERNKVRVLTDNGQIRPGKPGGNRVQVSRLANPLVNEVIIPLRAKDRWNTEEPENDAQFQRYYLRPELARLENLLYPVLDDTPTTNRGDLVAVLLTGVPGLNFTSNRRADLIRLNTAIPPSAPVGRGDRLGVLGGDFAGFPNGRRLEDDVTDIELRAVACGYGPVAGPLIESFGFCEGNANRTPNNTLGDGVDDNDRPFKVTFPYLGTPHQGYEHVHRHAAGGP